MPGGGGSDSEDVEEVDVLTLHGARTVDLNKTLPALFKAGVLVE